MEGSNTDEQPERGEGIAPAEPPPPSPEQRRAQRAATPPWVPVPGRTPGAVPLDPSPRWESWQPIRFGADSGGRQFEIDIDPPTRVTVERFEHYGGYLSKEWLRRYEVERLRDAYTAALEVLDELDARQADTP